MTKLAPSIKSQRLQSIFTIVTLGSQFTQTSINIIVHKYKTIKFDLVGKRPAKMHILDCLQSAFSLKIRLVLISSSSIVNRDVIITIRDPRFSRLAALPLVCLGFACSNFAKKSKRLLAVYAYPSKSAEQTKKSSGKFHTLKSQTMFFWSSTNRVARTIWFSNHNFWISHLISTM